MTRTCEQCTRSYDAKTARSRYCARTDCVRLRRRLQKQRERAPATVIAFPRTPGLNEAASSDGHRVRAIEVATLAELEACGRSHTVLGQASLALARKIDFGILETGASFASMIRELRATMGEATRGAGGVEDPIDELKRRRATKFGR